MDDVEVDGVDAEALQAPLDLRLRVPAARVELGRDEDVLARKAALAQGTAHAAFVAVDLGRVDVAVAGLQRPAHRVLTLAPVGHLPHAQPEQRDLVAVGEHPCPPVCRHRCCCHHALLDSGEELPSRVASARAGSPSSQGRPHRHRHRPRHPQAGHPAAGPGCTPTRLPDRAIRRQRAPRSVGQPVPTRTGLLRDGWRPSFPSALTVHVIGSDRRPAARRSAPRQPRPGAPASPAPAPDASVPPAH